MLLSCPLCCKPHFPGVDSLRSSLVSVATAPLTCPVCQEVLKGLDKLTIHLFGHVNSQQIKEDSVKSRTVCVDNEKDCDESIDEEIVRICTRTVQDPVTIDIAKQPEDPAPKDPSPSNLDNDNIISCDICSFTFTDKNILEMHQKLLHQTSPDEKTGKYSYHCHLCSKRFRMRGSLMVHLRVAHYGFSNRIDLPQRLLDSEDSDKSLKEVDAANKSVLRPQDCKQWSCDVCAKMFTTKYFLKKHKRLHTGEMPYSCTICQKSFTFQQSYHKHMLYHSSEKPYVCNECGRAFKEHSTLQNHARIHSGERPFGCEICGKRFRQRVSYLVHMRIHTGVMPYKCTECNKSFRYKVSQRSHKCPPGSVVKVNEDPPNPAPKCIMSVDYDTGNINLIPGNQELIILQNNDNNNAVDIYNVAHLSPILPEVESLCLNNNSPASPSEENIQIIREKCLEELFK
ncbi:unnamed protein product [Ceutorhynchus assimilis]|uniref:C2H2-type domain-containing protein n=1 Tax=Ceutorhynchus assimilis TaxID=467358 RepID=A0A9N9MXU1_9CUCU|nr:unnamed protein product [Ceutorhynchus assimilis]